VPIHFEILLSISSHVSQGRDRSPKPPMND
jgi:hypothetical protein